MPSPTRVPTAHHAPHQVSLAESAVEQLRERIANGNWEVGRRIPPEPELVRLLHIGRNTVREAVQVLVHAGLLERRQGSGTYVVADSELAVALHRQIPGATRRHVLEVRRGLEIEAARLAALRRTDADVAHLRDLDARCGAALAAGDADVLALADFDLHRAVVTMARNPVLGALYAHLLDAVAESIRENVTGKIGRAEGRADVRADGRADVRADVRAEGRGAAGAVPVSVSGGAARRLAAEASGRGTEAWASDSEPEACDGRHTRLVDAVAIGDEEAAAREVSIFHTHQLARLPEHP